MLADALRALSDEQLAALARTLGDETLVSAARSFALRTMTSFLGLDPASIVVSPSLPALSSARSVRRQKRGSPAETAEIVEVFLRELAGWASTEEIAAGTGYRRSAVQLALRGLVRCGTVEAKGATRSKRYRAALGASESAPCALPAPAETHDGPVEEPRIIHRTEDADCPLVLDERRPKHRPPPAPSRAWIKP